MQLPVQITSAFSVTNNKENIYNIYYQENTLFPCFAKAKYIS